MVDEGRALAWEREARDAHARFYGTAEPAGHFTAIILVLLRDREDLLRHCDRTQGN